MLTLTGTKVYILTRCDPYETVSKDLCDVAGVVSNSQCDFAVFQCNQNAIDIQCENSTASGHIQ